MEKVLKSIFSVIISLLLILSIVPAGCSQTPKSPAPIPSPKIEILPIKPQPKPEPNNKPVVITPFQSKGGTDKTTYNPTEKVKIKISLINYGSEPVKLSPFQPEIIISRFGSSDKVNNSRSFAGGSQETEILGGTKATYETVWDQKYDDGRQAEPGWYTIDAEYSWGTVNLRPENYIKHRVPIIAIVISFPAGQAINRVIDVNQSVTIKGLPLRLDKGKITDVTMTLQLIELTNEGIKVSVLASSPHYSLPFPSKGPFDVSPEWLGRMAVAEYTVDGVTKPAGPPVSNPVPEGMLLEWGKSAYNPLDPVSKNAKAFTFTIDKWGDWQGPWQFHVPLN